ncbi:MAG: cadmium resistance protein CadD (predicted permease) [Halieaceae bacterium]|jgi:cadmium resistance protein CadD (predicted permease)
MNNLMLILLCIFISVALMVILGERFSKPVDSQKMQKLSRWILPLVGLAVVLSLLKYVWN